VKRQGEKKKQNEPAVHKQHDRSQKRHPQEELPDNGSGYELVFEWTKVLSKPLDEGTIGEGCHKKQDRYNYGAGGQLGEVEEGALGQKRDDRADGEQAETESEKGRDPPGDARASGRPPRRTRPEQQ
jgi:hypothetical protein